MPEILLLFLLLAGMFVILAGGAACLFVGTRDAARRFGAASVVVGSLLGILPAIAILLGEGPIAAETDWSMPFGRFSIGVDPLSAWFLLGILGLSAVSALYGVGYTRREHSHRRTGAREFLFSALVLSMALVVVARNGLLFLLAWEVMALSSFFLVTSESEKESVRHAGWVYLVASQAGAAFVLILFLLMGRESGSTDFDAWLGLAGRWAHPTALFALAMVGFGTKAGFMPLHVWLPEAHPAAPSHVSALMSGVMIKTGIYGLLRVMLLLGPPDPSWAWALLALGATSGVLGVLFALAQHDLKRLLAYHSIENIGIIALGLGLGTMGVATGRPLLAAAGFAGALLHVLNHAIFKGLLFLSAGAVVQATSSRDIDRLGGLLKAMPWTGLSFLVGSVAICGLPPLNGFVSEALIYYGALRGVTDGLPWPVASVVVLASLGLIGGLACACFAKAFGVVFLGSPRSATAEPPKEVGAWMQAPMLILSATCLAIGLAAPLAVGLVAPVVAQIASAFAQPSSGVSGLEGIARSISVASLILLGLLLLLAGVRFFVLKGRPVRTSVTWDCGYAKPTPRMQYTASSFAQPLTHFFGGFLRARTHGGRPDGLVPRAPVAFSSHTPQVCTEEAYTPLFRGVVALFSRLKGFQHGRLQLYVLYVSVTLLGLLILKLR